MPRLDSGGPDFGRGGDTSLVVEERVEGVLGVVLGLLGGGLDDTAAVLADWLLTGSDGLARGEGLGVSGACGLGILEGMEVVSLPAVSVG